MVVRACTVRRVWKISPPRNVSGDCTSSVANAAARLARGRMLTEAVEQRSHDQSGQEEEQSPPHQRVGAATS